jgi:hypothetical protein
MVTITIQRHTFGRTAGGKQSYFFVALQPPISCPVGRRQPDRLRRVGNLEQKYKKIKKRLSVYRITA